MEREGLHEEVSVSVMAMFVQKLISNCALTVKYTAFAVEKFLL